MMSVVGLEVGADDYIAKPFHLREVLARVRSVLRRRQPAPSHDAGARTSKIYCFEGLRRDVPRRRLSSDDGSEILLTTDEFDMLYVLVKHAGRAQQREVLTDLTRGRDLDAVNRTIDTQIARLRRKIEHDPSRPALIEAVRGVGWFHRQDDMAGCLARRFVRLSEAVLCSANVSRKLLFSLSTFAAGS